MADEVRFRPDLYAGTAGYYDRYRPRYPVGLVRRLVDEAGVTGGGRLLDLACGTGQVALGLSSYFEEVWAVDQEADMVRGGRSSRGAYGCSQYPLAQPVGRGTDGAAGVVRAGHGGQRLSSLAQAVDSGQGIRVVEPSWMFRPVVGRFTLAGRRRVATGGVGRPRVMGG